MHETRSRLLSAGALLFSMTLGCQETATNLKPDTPGDKTPEATPVVEYSGPKGEKSEGQAEPELLYAPPTHQYDDLGPIRITCADPGCSFNTAAKALVAKAHELGLRGVHSLTESSGKINDAMEYLARQNARVYVLSGMAFSKGE